MSEGLSLCERSQSASAVVEIVADETKSLEALIGVAGGGWDVAGGHGDRTADSACAGTGANQATAGAITQAKATCRRDRWDGGIINVSCEQRLRSVAVQHNFCLLSRRKITTNRDSAYNRCDLPIL